MTLLKGKLDFIAAVFVLCAIGLSWAARTYPQMSDIKASASGFDKALERIGATPLNCARRGGVIYR